MCPQHPGRKPPVKGAKGAGKGKVARSDVWFQVVPPATGALKRPLDAGDTSVMTRPKTQRVSRETSSMISSVEGPRHCAWNVPGESRPRVRADDSDAKHQGAHPRIVRQT